MLDFADRIYIEACPNSDYLWEADPSVFDECDKMCEHMPHPTTVEYIRADLYDKMAALLRRSLDLDLDNASAVLDSFKDEIGALIGEEE